jgi:hypothetical protein
MEKEEIPEEGERREPARKAKVPRPPAAEEAPRSERVAHYPSNKRFLIFMPGQAKTDDPNVPVIFDILFDAEIICTKCKKRVVGFMQGVGAMPADGAADAFKRTVICPYCEREKP